MRISRSSLATIASLGLAALTLTACTSGDHDSPDGETTVEEIEIFEEEDGATSFADGTLTSSKLTIDVADAKVIAQGDPGNEYGEAPVIAFWFETTNTSGEQIDPLTAWLTHFRAIQGTESGITELPLGMIPDEKLAATRTSAIDKGDTIVSAVAYILTDEQAQVELIATDLRLNEVGRSSYPQD